MTDKYVVVDKLGRAMAFYDRDMHGDSIPADAVRISEETWRRWISNCQEQVLDNGQLIRVKRESLMPLAEMVAMKQRRVNMRRDWMFSKGFSWRGHVFDLDHDAQSSMLRIYALLKSGMANPHGGAWRTRDNEMIVMSDAELEDFLLAAFDYIQRIRQTSWKHKDRLAAMGNPAEVSAYDVDVAWPVMS